MRQNCASGLPNSARLALYLFVYGRGRLSEFAAEMFGTLRKSNELENVDLSIDNSAPERFCEEFRSGVNLSCAPNINPCAESSSPPKWGNLVGMTLGVGSLKCTLQHVSVEGMAPGVRKPLLVSMSVLLSATAGKLKMEPFATYELNTVTPNWKPGDGELAPNLNSGEKVGEGD